MQTLMKNINSHMILPMYFHDQYHQNPIFAAYIVEQQSAGKSRTVTGPMFLIDDIH